jgi:hypothetical protein
MRRDRTAVALINRGRIVKLSLATYNAYDPPMFVGWVIDEGTH